MLAEAGVTVPTGRCLQSVIKSGPRISGIVTSEGAFTGRLFIDGSHEGDLMAAAGVGRRIDRESSADILETHKQHALEIVHFMKTDPVFTRARRDGIAGWGSCADGFVGDGNIPPRLHVRAGRRMWGARVIKQSARSTSGNGGTVRPVISGTNSRVESSCGNDYTEV